RPRPLSPAWVRDRCAFDSPSPLYGGGAGVGVRLRTYILRRIVHMVPVLLGVITVVFVALRLIPGDPAIALAGDKASVAQIEQMREALGLNRPLPVQYVEFVTNILTGQLGASIRTRASISKELPENFAPTVELSLAALLIAVA